MHIKTVLSLWIPVCVLAKLSLSGVVVVVVVKRFKFLPSLSPFIMLGPALWTAKANPHNYWPQCHGTSLSQPWTEDGLSSDIASGVEMVPVTPPPPPSHTTLCVCVCIVARWALFVWHHCPLFLPDHCRYNGHCICSHKEKLFLQATEASFSSPSLSVLVTPVTAEERGLDQI